MTYLIAYIERSTNIIRISTLRINNKRSINIIRILALSSTHYTSIKTLIIILDR